MNLYAGWNEAYGLAARIKGMAFPVRCRCGAIYDVGKVTVTARYLDCSVWKTPCCKQTADDRGDTGWGIKHYERIGW